MLPKSQRLSRAEFTRYFGEGRRLHTPFLTLIHAAAPGFKAAAVAGKKAAKKAHERNTLRRRIYATMASYKSELRGVYIVVAKPAFFIEPRRLQHEHVRSLLGRAMKGR